MKQVLLKIIVIIVDKLTRNRVLRDRARLRGAPRGGDGTRKFSLSCEAGAKTPSFEPVPPYPIASPTHDIY